MSDVSQIARVGVSCGLHYLSVAGVVVAMEGDKCRDGDLPDHIYPPIPECEMENGSIGGKPIKNLDLKLIRFFRGDNWTHKMLTYAADRINNFKPTPA